MDVVEFFFDPARFVPRGHCGLWDEKVMVLYMVSNVLIWAAFMLIPTILLFMTTDYQAIVRDKPLRVIFATFIFFCGLGHLEGVFSFYWPTYHLYAIWDMLTAIVCWIAVGMLLGRYQAMSKARKREESARSRFHND